MVHLFQTSIEHLSLPDKFTYPFHYTPHPLCLVAAKEVQAYINAQTWWIEERSKGKMFGVLVVQMPTNELGYLAAFSGHLKDGESSFFVPLIYDLLQPNGFFKQEEGCISTINKQIKALEGNEELAQLKQQLKGEAEMADKEINAAKYDALKAKQERDKRRISTTDLKELEAMTRESQFMKAELKRLECRWRESLTSIKQKVEQLEQQMIQLKSERKKRSANLQQKLFQQFRLLNARGEIKDLCDIFANTAQQVPPAGAGECAAPKLLQYAYQKELKPIAMAEFWWGESPKTEIRRQGFFYPACQGKCGPILKHMLQGLEVEDNPLEKVENEYVELEIVYEDQWVVVINKPYGILSVPGKSSTQTSIYDFLRQRYPDATGPIVVHRLDMATSGLLLGAKSKEVHQNLQAQFKNRTIKKEYIALLEGIIDEKEGYIDLPLLPDYVNRPRQMVDFKEGKSAMTYYRVIDEANGVTRVLFQPLTGRTHQLRVHAAHKEGLNCPIRGDELYGQQAERLYLHAESIAFKHPITGKTIQLQRKADF